MVATWFGVLDAPHIDPITNFLQFGRVISGKKNLKVRQLIWLTATWVIWGDRNEIVFQGVPVNTTIMFKRLVNLSWGWFVGKAGRNDDVSRGTLIRFKCLNSA